MYLKKKKIKISICTDFKEKLFGIHSNHPIYFIQNILCLNI